MQSQTQPPGRIALSVGFGAGRVIFLLVMGVLLVLTSAALGAMIGLIFTLGSSSAAAAVTAGVFAATAFVCMTLLLFFAVRRAAWVDGSVLAVRGFRTRSVDLVEARSVTVTSKGQSAARRVPLILVTGPRGTIRLPLRRRGGALIAPAEMHLLATTLSAGRCPGAAEAVAWLRALAVHPHTPFS